MKLERLDDGNWCLYRAGRWAIRVRLPLVRIYWRKR